MAYDNKGPYEDENVGNEVYEEEGLEYLEENDEITPEEEAFMEGYKQTPPARIRTTRKKVKKISNKKKPSKKKPKRKFKKSRKHTRRKRR